MVVEVPSRRKIKGFKRTHERQDVWVTDHAVTFDEYLTKYEGCKEHIELIKGVPTTRMAANLGHEALHGWLHVLLYFYTQSHDLGHVYGSRTAIKISNFDGRLPDILFVRKERLEILDWLKLKEEPDMVLELTSPNDRPSDKMNLESDYRTIGVPEIVFVDMQGKAVRTLRKVDSEYQTEELTAGVLRFETIPGFWLDISWIFAEPRPLVHEVIKMMEAPAGTHIERA